MTLWPRTYFKPSTPCNCGSGEHRQELIDAGGNFVAYVCSECEKKVRKRYRPEIFDTSHPYASSGKEDDLEIDYDTD